MADFFRSTRCLLALVLLAPACADETIEPSGSDETSGPDGASEADEFLFGDDLY